MADWTSLNALANAAMLTAFARETVTVTPQGGQQSDSFSIRAIRMQRTSGSTGPYAPIEEIQVNPADYPNPLQGDAVVFSGSDGTQYPYVVQQQPKQLDPDGFISLNLVQATVQY